MTSVNSRNMGRFHSYHQLHTLPSKTHTRPLSAFALFTSNQIPHALSARPLSPECAWRVESSTNMSQGGNCKGPHAHTVKNQCLGLKSFAFSLPSPLAEAELFRLIERVSPCLSLLFVFSPNAGFSGKTGQGACVELGAAGGFETVVSQTSIQVLNRALFLNVGSGGSTLGSKRTLTQRVYKWNRVDQM